MKTTSQLEKVFGRAAVTYDQHAEVQQQAAHLLAKRLAPLVGQLPPGPVLELACGTGLFTEQLLAFCSDRQVIVSDLAREMLQSCQARFDGRATFTVLDAQDLSVSNKYALIACSFGLQWFGSIAVCLDRIMDAVLPGGCLLFAVPTEGSFPEWKTIAARLGLEFTGNKLPAAGAINNYCLRKRFGSDLHATQIRISYPSSLAFFQALRQIGAQSRLPAEGASREIIDVKSALSAAKLRSLIRGWDQAAGGAVTVTYDVLYGAVRK